MERIVRAIKDYYEGTLQKTSDFENIDKSKDELYLENSEKASLEDVCKWWIKTYPPDVFVNKPKPIVEARMCMQNILVMMHKPGVNKPSLSQNNKKEDGIPPTNKNV